MSLQSKVALITGGSRGIGRAIAEKLHQLGATVIVTGRSLDTLNALAETLNGTAVEMDLSSRPQSQEAIEAIQQKFGAIDILVNNAGIADAAPIKRVSLQSWDNVFEVNVTAVFRLCKAFLPGMEEKGWGRVINIASNAGLTGYGYSAPYCASKHAVVGFTRAMAIDLGDSGVTINAVCPGWVDTDMARDAIQRIADTTGRTPEKAREVLERMSPQKRMVAPEEVAAIVAMLCSDDAKSIHGQAIVVDGGQVLK
jgi:NAD(P)-dependent dehydrogenase (short-subunit alcohol dehydrogenase family)